MNRFAEVRDIRHGFALRGLLLASSDDRMPDELVLGEVVPAEIKIYDRITTIQEKSFCASTVNPNGRTD